MEHALSGSFHVKPLHLPTILGSRNLFAEVPACFTAPKWMFSAWPVSFFFVLSDTPSLHNYFCHAIIYHLKKYFFVFILNLLLAFIWCFLNLLRCKTICHSPFPWLMVVEVPARVPRRRLLPPVCFVSPHEEPTRHHHGCFLSIPV